MQDYKPIPLEQFHDFIDGKAAVPPKAVLLTFDDGYQDFRRISAGRNAHETMALLGWYFSQK